MTVNAWITIVPKGETYEDGQSDLGELHVIGSLNANPVAVEMLIMQALEDWRKNH